MKILIILVCVLSLVVFFLLLTCTSLQRKISSEHDVVFQQIEKIKYDSDSASKALSAFSTKTNNDFAYLTDSTKSMVSLSQSMILKQLADSEKRSNALASNLCLNITATLEKKIDELSNNLAAIKLENQNLRKELDFYINIETDSGNLNVTDNINAQNNSLDSSSKNQPDKQELTEDTITLDNEQEYALKIIENTNQNIFITGKAGTGKSFLLSQYRKATKKSHLVVAPTGVSALNVEGTTIHSAFGYSNLVSLDINEITEKTLKLKTEKQTVLRHVDTIIIDEISMVRADTFDKIDKILKVLSHSSEPFGGKQIVVFGDLFQLPPITKTIEEKEYLTDKYGGTFFFMSNAYQEGNFHFVELANNHRQQGDKTYFEILNRIREGTTTDDDIDVLNSRVAKDITIYDRDRYITLFSTKKEAESVNNERLRQLHQKTYTYLADIILDKQNNKNKNLDMIFPISAELKLKVGALVMMVANDPDHRWVNGTLGIVRSLSDAGIQVSINKRTYDIPKNEFAEYEAIYLNGKITYIETFKIAQYPLVLAYAMTIHKAQGQTYSKVICDVNRCFAPGQAYVALSRCVSLDGIHLKNEISKTDILVDKDVADFYAAQKTLQTAF